MHSINEVTSFIKTIEVNYLQNYDMQVSYENLNKVIMITNKLYHQLKYDKVCTGAPDLFNDEYYVEDQLKILGIPCFIIVDTHHIEWDIHYTIGHKSYTAKLENLID